MALKDQISELVTPAVSDQGFYLEDVHVATPGNHRIVTCIVDGDVSLNLDQVTSVSRVISELLDEAAFMGEIAYVPAEVEHLHPNHLTSTNEELMKLTEADREYFERKWSE